jgi:Zn-dependent protease with chaperone function
MEHRRQRGYPMMPYRILVAGLLGFLVATPAAAQDGPKVKLEGYAEFNQNGTLTVEGQRVVTDRKTKFKGDGIRDLASIPLGYEVKVEGRRQRDGTVHGTKIEAKPNGSAMYESEVVNATNQIEKAWVDAGEMYMGDGRRRQSVGDILDSGYDVERVRGIMLRLLPPSINADDVRVHVVETKEWNASAMGNGSIWVYTGLLHDMDDDEIAIILGHELAHYTHEHSRKGMKNGMWGQIAGIAGTVGVGAIDGGASRTAAELGTSLGLSAWQSGYSRQMEDQSDRVGLRYAYEAGFDVSKGPELWQKFRKKYGEADTMSNFLYGSHSRPTDRIRNIRRELRVTYQNALE